MHDGHFPKYYNTLEIYCRPVLVRLWRRNLRTFDSDDMRVAYENQKGVCPICKGKFAFEEMRDDHIKPWSKGGKTMPENLQMLCADCNARKSDKF